MNIRIFWVRAMKCMCAQTRPRFILSSERVFGGMEFEPMLTPREKSPLPENVPRGGSNPRRCGQRAQALPTELFQPPYVLCWVMLDVFPMWQQFVFVGSLFVSYRMKYWIYHCPFYITITIIITVHFILLLLLSLILLLLLSSSSPSSSSSSFIIIINRLIGLVVKASASRSEDPGFESRLLRDFFGVESYQCLQNWLSSGYPARRLAL